MRQANAPFELWLCPSRAWLAWVIVVVVLLAVTLTAHVSVWLLPPLVWAGWRALAADGWLGRPRIERIRVAPSGRISVCLRGCAEQEAVLGAHSVVWPWLLVLNLTLGARRVTQVIFPDSAPRDAQRRLRVFVRWSGDAADQKRVTLVK